MGIMISIKLVHRYFRLSPFDITTEQGRTDERYRLAILSILANVLSRCIAMAVMILSVNLTVPYLGAERFGVWMTIASFAGMLTFLDLGVGNALTNHIAKASACNNEEELRRAVSGGLGFLFLLGLVVGGGLTIAANFIPWVRVIKVDDFALTGEIRHATMLFAALFGLNLFTSGIQRVFVGMQRAFEGHLAMALGAICALLALWLAANLSAGVPVLLAVTLGTQSLSGFILFILLIKRKLFQLNGIITAINSEKKILLHTGGLFFILQIGTMVGWGADSLIISSTLGAAYVAIFSVTQRLFQFVTQPLGMINSPLWASYADAHNRGDRQFIRSTLKRSVLFTAFVASFSVVFVLFISDWIVYRWTKGAVVVPVSVVVVFGFWTIVDAVANSFAMFMNGCHIIKAQVYNVISMCVLSVPVKLWLISFYGLDFMLIGFICVYLFNFILWYGFVFNRNIRNYLM